jgi:hypothetical protein
MMLRGEIWRRGQRAGPCNSSLWKICLTFFTPEAAARWRITGVKMNLEVIFYPDYARLPPRSRREGGEHATCMCFLDTARLARAVFPDGGTPKQELVPADEGHARI